MLWGKPKWATAARTNYVRTYPPPKPGVPPLIGHAYSIIRQPTYATTGRPTERKAKRCGHEYSIIRQPTYESTGCPTNLHSNEHSRAQRSGAGWLQPPENQSGSRVYAWAGEPGGHTHTHTRVACIAGTAYIIYAGAGKHVR